MVSAWAPVHGLEGAGTPVTLCGALPQHLPTHPLATPTGVMSSSQMSMGLSTLALYVMSCVHAVPSGEIDTAVVSASGDQKRTRTMPT